MIDKPSWTELLDLAPNATVEDLGESPPPASEVGRGFSLDAIVLENLDPSYTRLDFQGCAHELDVQRWDHDPAIVRVTAPSDDIQLDVLTGSRYARDASDVVLDTRTQDAVVICPSPAGALAVHVRGGYVRLARLHEAGSPALAAFSHTPRTQPRTLLTLPAVDALLEGAVCHEWLRREYEARVDSTSLVERFAALGLVARLWSPTTARDRKLVIEWMRAGRGTSASRVADWLAAHDGVAVGSEAAELVLASAASLLDRVSNLAPLAETLTDLQMADVIAGVRVDRDELESVAVAVHLAGVDTSGLRDVIAAIDERARLRMTLISHLGAHAPTPERLKAVVQEVPDAWWALEGR